MSFANPFEADGQWYRGNLHSHTTESDGRLSPGDVVEFYRSRGYDFLCLTDHNRVTDPGGLSSEDFLVFSGVETSPASSHHHTRLYVCWARASYSMGHLLATHGPWMTGVFSSSDYVMYGFAPATARPAFSFR